MESLSDEIWDLVIAGTSLPQALLALSLSRSNLKILHVDKHEYYGGEDAGLSLDEAQAWAAEHKDDGQSFSNVQILQSSGPAKGLAASRTYTLSLRPQIIYASSSFLPSLVTSRIHNQLEFLAVGSWWIHKDGNLRRIPSTREDVFADDNLSRKDKMVLMKFLRYLMQDETIEGTNTEIDPDTSLEQALTSRFKVQAALQPALTALALTQEPAHITRFDTAVSRIRRHMSSMGHFGPGFAAVYPKYAGNAEVSQVACRAGAVGGAVYLLGQGLTSIDTATTDEESKTLKASLSDGTIIKAKHVVGGLDDLPSQILKDFQLPGLLERTMLCMIAIVSAPLRHLFPQTSDSGPIPAVAIVLVDDMDVAGPNTNSPMYLQVHSEDTGECPVGQCIIYAQIQLHQSTGDLETNRTRMYSIIRGLISSPANPPSETETTPGAGEADVLWSMSYTTSGLPIGTKINEPYLHDTSGCVNAFPPRSLDMAFDDEVMRSVKALWAFVSEKAGNETEFMCFEERNRGDE